MSSDLSDSSERPPVAQAAISLVLFAGNPDTHAVEVVDAWYRFLKGRNQEFEIVFVHGGAPTEEAKELAESLTRGYPSVRVLQEQVRGAGASLSAGIAAAQHPLLCYAPCDKQFQPPDLSRLLDQIDNVDVAIGYRATGRPPAWLLVADRLWAWLARIVLGYTPQRRDSWLGWAGWRRRWLARWVFGLRVRDPECPFRLIRRRVFRRIPIQSRGSLAHLEILAKANHLGCLMAEAPVSWMAPTNVAPETDADLVRDDLRNLLRRPDFGPPRIDDTGRIEENPQPQTPAPSCGN